MRAGKPPRGGRNFDLLSPRVSVTCLKCEKPLAKPTAGISTCPMGDEIIYSYFFCPGCDIFYSE